MLRVADYIQIPTENGTFDALAAGPDDGRPVLLLHGFPEAGLQWSGQLPVLAGAGCRAVAPDQRGYSPGARPESIFEYRQEALVDDVLAIAEQLGWQRFDLVGHDWGAAVSWAVAAFHPDRVRSLTALSVPHPEPFGRALREDEDQHRRSSYMQAFQAASTERTLLADDARKLRGIYERKVPEAHVEEYVRRLSEPGALTGALNWYRAMRYSSPLGPVRVPTLYAWGTEDVAIGSTAALNCGEHVEAPYRFEMLEDVSHWIPEEAPETTARLVLENLHAHQE